MSRLRIMVINTVSEVNQNSWNDLVTKSDLGSVFHRYEWLKAIEESIVEQPDLETRHIIVFKDHNIVGIFPNFLQKIEGTPLKKLVSAYPIFGGPVISRKNEETILEKLFQNLPNICGRNIISHHIRTSSLNYIRYADYLAEKRIPIRAHAFMPVLH